MKKLGKRSSLESGTFFAYACNCNCGRNHAFYISNYIQDGLSLNTYMPIKYIRQEQHDVEEKWQKFGEGIYYKSKIALLVENLIQTLNGYKEIEIL